MKIEVIRTISMTKEQAEKLDKLTYENHFGTNRSAFIRKLIEDAWNKAKETTK